MSKVTAIPARQRGMVLIVALAILLVISLIAITSMKTAVLEERMATNMQNSVMVFQAAETALDQTLRDILLLTQITASNTSEDREALLHEDSPITASVAVSFVREIFPADGDTPDATQAGGSWQGGGVGNAGTATRYYEGDSHAQFSNNPNIQTRTTQGFFYCIPGCQ